MARKKASRIEVEPPKDPVTGATIPDEPEAAAAASEPSEAPRKKNTITIPLKDDGSIDMGVMRDSTRAKLTEAVKRSGMAQTMEIPTGPAFGASVSDHIWAIVGSIESAILVKYFDSGDVAAVVPYRSAELEILKDPTGRIIDKYAGGLGKYQDEAQLLLAFVGITQAKVMELQRRADGRAEAAAKRAAAAAQAGGDNV